MGRGRPRKKDLEETSFEKESAPMRDPDKDVKKEDKAEWMKRRAAEDKEIKENRAKPVDEWIEVIKGRKVILCRKKKNAGVFRKYLFDAKKHPNKLEVLKKDFKVKDV